MIQPAMIEITPSDQPPDVKKQYSMTSPRLIAVAWKIAGYLAKSGYQDPAPDPDFQFSQFVAGPGSGFGCICTHVETSNFLSSGSFPFNPSGIGFGQNQDQDPSLYKIWQLMRKKGMQKHRAQAASTYPTG